MSCPKIIWCLRRDHDSTSSFASGECASSSTSNGILIAPVQDTCAAQEIAYCFFQEECIDQVTVVSGNYVFSRAGADWARPDVRYLRV